MARTKAPARPRRDRSALSHPPLKVVTVRHGQRVIFLGELDAGTYTHFFSHTHAHNHGHRHGVTRRMSAACLDQVHDEAHHPDHDGTVPPRCPICDDAELPYSVRKVQCAYYAPALVMCPHRNEWVFAVVAVPNASRHSSHFYSRRLTGLRCTVERTGWSRGGCVALAVTGRWSRAAEFAFDIEPVLEARYGGSKGDCVRLRYSLPHPSTLPGLEAEEPATAKTQAPPATEARPANGFGLTDWFTRPPAAAPSPVPPAPKTAAPEPVADAPDSPPPAAPIEERLPDARPAADEGDLVVLVAAATSPTPIEERLPDAPPATEAGLAARFDAPEPVPVEPVDAAPSPVPTAPEIPAENASTDAPICPPATAGEGGAPPPLAPPPPRKAGISMESLRRYRESILLGANARYRKEKGAAAADALLDKVNVGFPAPAAKGGRGAA